MTRKNSDNRQAELKVRQLHTRKELKQFIDFQWEVYKNDPYWVPPLKFDLLKSFSPKNNPLLSKGPHAFFMAFRGRHPAGRILAIYNREVNESRNNHEGWFSLFEALDEDREAAEALFAKVEDWLKEQGATSMFGPVSPTNGDDNKGVMIEGFDMQPTLMNSYNHRWVPEFFDSHGFVKARDLFGYYGDRTLYNPDKYDKVIEYAMRKYKYRLVRFEFGDVRSLVKDMHEILVKSSPEWENYAVPSEEDIMKEVKSLRSLADLDLLYMARSTEDNRPIGFLVALPDYNEVLKRLNGRLFPVGFIKMLYYRKRIKGIRFFIQFVIPEYQNTGVNVAIMYRCATAGLKKGYDHADGSTIGEENTKAIHSVEGIGMRKYKTFRYYRKVFAGP
ncbi:MAG TPA: hypothetical protein DD727_00090 [Clostridiales bacterium]|nr:hypothetical protein [Clostridiales bacterium]